MSVSQDYLDRLLARLGVWAPVTARRMFGGAGLYSEGRIFGVVDDDRVYFKVDDVDRPTYEAAGSVPFRPYGDAGYSMSYYEVPGVVLDDDGLGEWIERALAASARSSRRKAR